MTEAAAQRPGNEIEPHRPRAEGAERRARQLLEAIADGHEASMSVFYRRYEPVVHAFALSRLNDAVFAADDVVNEVMLAVWRSAAGFRGESGVRTWLLGIANNKVRDVLRRGGPWHCRELDGWIPDTSSPGCERTAVDSEYRRCLKRCLQALSDEHRQVVHLAFFEDLSYPEIARVINCPVGTVKTRMYHARIVLKRSLRRMGVTDPN